MGIGNSRASDLSGHVLRSAAVVGALAFAAGFAAPLLLSSSNLGPLVGIFITGPLGALAGALWGVLKAARNDNPPPANAIIAWLAATWGAILLYTLFLIGLTPQSAVPAIGLQGLVLASSASLLYAAGSRTLVSTPIRRCGPIALATLALVIVTSAFPPVTRPWWGTTAARARLDSIAVPKRAFLIDSRFDASRQVPLLAVDRRRLMLEWLILGGAALALGRFVCAAPNRPRADA